MDDLLRLKAENEIMKTDLNSKVVEALELNQKLFAKDKEFDDVRHQNDMILKYLVTLDSLTEGSIESIRQLNTHRERLDKEAKALRQLCTELNGSLEKINEENKELRETNSKRYCGLAPVLEQFAKEIGASTKNVKLLLEVENLKTENSQLCAQTKDLEQNLDEMDQTLLVINCKLQAENDDLVFKVEAQKKVAAEFKARLHADTFKNDDLNSVNLNYSCKLEQTKKTISDLEAETELLKGEKSRLATEINKMRLEFEQYRKTKVIRKQQLIKCKTGLQVNNESLSNGLDAVKLLANHLNKSPGTVQREEAASALENPAATSLKRETNEEIIAELSSEVARLEAENSQRLEKKQQMCLVLESTKRRGIELNQELETKTARMSETKSKGELLWKEIQQVKQDTARLQGENQELEGRLRMKEQVFSELSNEFEAVEQEQFRKIQKMKAGIEEKQKEIESLREFNGKATGMLETMKSDQNEDESYRRCIVDLLKEQRAALKKVESVVVKLRRTKKMVKVRTATLVESTHQLRAVVDGCCRPIEVHLSRCLEELQIVRAETAALNCEKKELMSEKAQLATGLQELERMLINLGEEAKDAAK